MAYQAKITGPCPHDGMTVPLHLEENGSTGWPPLLGLLDVDGTQILYPLLRTEPVPFDFGHHPSVLLTAIYGPQEAS